MWKHWIQRTYFNTLSLVLSPDHSDLPTLTPSPNSAQMFEYKDLNLSCGIQGWTVKRFSTFDKQVSRCEVWGKATSYGCILHKIRGLDSAVYWCESPTHQRSNSVNITVYGRSGFKNLIWNRSPQNVYEWEKTKHVIVMLVKHVSMLL